MGSGKFLFCYRKKTVLKTTLISYKIKYLIKKKLRNTRTKAIWKNIRKQYVY